MRLETRSRFPDPDAAYNALIDAHRDLSEEESGALNARLVLLLSNHIGVLAVLQEALALARQSLSCGEKPGRSRREADPAG